MTKSILQFQNLQLLRLEERQMIVESLYDRDWSSRCRRWHRMSSLRNSFLRPFLFFQLRAHGRFPSHVLRLPFHVQGRHPSISWKPDFFSEIPVLPALHPTSKITFDPKLSPRKTSSLKSCCSVYTQT